MTPIPSYFPIPVPYKDPLKFDFIAPLSNFQGVVTIGKDDTPTADSVNMVTSAGLYQAFLDDRAAWAAADTQVLTTAKTYADQAAASLNAYRFKGAVSTYADLPGSAAVGDVYDVADSGMNYAWTGEKWDALGSVFDPTELENALAAETTRAKGAENQAINAAGVATQLAQNVAKQLSGYVPTAMNPLAIGESATASSTNSIALGNGAQSTGDNGVALGRGTIAISKGIAVGYKTYAGESAVSIGDISDAESVATSSAKNSVAIGTGASARAEASTALGRHAIVPSAGTHAVALGYYAGASADHAVQLGEGTNSTANSLQFMGYPLLVDGKIPSERLPVIDVGVTSVNNVEPDESGNVEVSAEDIPMSEGSSISVNQQWKNHLTETNPHKVTAAQVGALALTGGTVTGDVAVHSCLNLVGELSITGPCVAFSYPEKEAVVALLPPPDDVYPQGAEQVSVTMPSASGTLALTSDIPTVDATLAKSGAAADAKATGDALAGKLSVTEEDGIKQVADTVCFNGDIISAGRGGYVQIFGSSNGARITLVKDEEDPNGGAFIDAYSLDCYQVNDKPMAKALAKEISTSDTDMHTAVYNLALPFMQEVNARFYYEQLFLETGENDVDLTPDMDLSGTKYTEYHTMWDAEYVEGDLELNIHRTYDPDGNAVDAILFLPFAFAGTTSFSINWNLGTYGEDFFVVLDSGQTWDEFAGSWDLTKNYILTITEIGFGVYMMAKKEVSYGS